MRKLKLIVAACALMGASATWAQTDVTSTYLTNADFEGAYTEYSRPTQSGSNARAIYQPNGWTVTYTNGEGNDMTALDSESLQWSNFSSKAKPTAGGAKTYWIRFRWGNSESLTLSQTVSLPAGKYCFSADAFFNGASGATAKISANSISTTVTGNSTWANYEVNFVLASETSVTLSLNLTQTKQEENIAAFDNFKLTYTEVVVKDILETALTAAKNANATLSNSDLASAITTAQAVYDDADATQDEVNAAAATLNAATELAMSAVGDVTGIFISNPGFEGCTAETSDVAAKTKKDYSSAGWTNASTGDYSAIAVTAYGDGVKVATSTTPATKKDGTTVSGNTLGIIAGWGDNVTIQSGDVTLPAGVYTLTVDHYLTSTTDNYGNTSSKFGFVTSGSSYLVSSTTFSASTWTTETVTFTLTESTTGKIQIGLTGLDKVGSVAPAVFYDDITITYKSFLAGAKEAWDEAVAAAGTAKTENPSVTGEELTALNAELAKAEPTTVDGYNAATEALTNATSALVAAAASYNALATVNGLITAAGTLTYADADKKPSAEVTATSAADATAKTASQYTALRAYYESHALAEGVSGAEDYTSAVAAANADTNTGWTNGIGTNQGQGYTDADGNVASKYLDGGWASNAGVNIDMTRDVVIPAGKYLLTVTARGAVDLDEYTLSIGGETINLPHANGGSNGVFGNGWNDASVEFEADGTTQTLEVKATSSASQQWISINRFRLVQLELNNDAYANADDYAALNAAIEAAEPKTTQLGFEDAEYAPYANAEALVALAAAKAIDQTAELTNLKTTVNAATDALTTATWTANNGAVAIVYNGDMQIANGYNPKGWTRSNGAWGQQVDVEGANSNKAWYYNTNGAWEYGKDAIYTMPLKGNTIYTLNFKYRSQVNNSNNWLKSSVLNSDGEGLAVVQNPKAEGTAWVSISKVFKTGAAGNYVLLLEQNGNTFVTDVTIDRGSTIEESIEVTEAGYATYVSDNDLDFSEVTGLTAYKATVSESTITFNKVTTVPAGEGVLLKGEGTFAVPATAGIAAWAEEDNAFIRGTGAAVASEADGKYNYILNKVGDVVGFYQAAGQTVATNRAYLQSTADAARLTIVFDDEATGISTIKTAQNNGTIYNMNGQRVENAKKGLYIVNGKKVVLK